MSRHNGPVQDHGSDRQQWELTLLALARQTLEVYISTGRVPMMPSDDPRLLEPAAVFVTLRTRSADPHTEGDLRGCVGQVEARAPLYEAVQDATIQAATADPRFVPVRESELAALVIEISILSPMKPVRDLREIEIGRDGLMITGMGRRGLLLPSVPLHYGWHAAEFLDGLYAKAGLPVEAWPDRAALYSFTTRSISE